MPALTRRRLLNHREEWWEIYYGDIHTGTTAERTGNPHDTEPWEWRCGFYPGSRPAPASLLNSRDAPPALAPAKDRRGWLARIVGSKSVASATPPNEALTGRPTPGAVSATTNDAAEYNWSGFSCPFCNAAGFVSCGGGHLACDGTIQVRKDGRFHQCFCGREIISGMIRTHVNERLSVEAEVDRPNAPPAVRPQQSSKSADAALPTPAHGLPAKR